MINKFELQNILINNQNEIIKTLQEKISAIQSEIDLDESDTIDPEDLSHQSEAVELKNLYLAKLLKAQKDLNELTKLDVSGKNIAEAGALVSTENFNFLLGFPTIPFNYCGRKIVGVSVDSPIYPQILGKRVGDDFSFSNNNYKILEII